MSSWNYRVRQRNGKDFDGEEYVTFDIIETYYNEVGELEGWTSEIAPQGETLYELHQDMERMRQAFEKPVLIIETTELLNGETEEAAFESEYDPMQLELPLNA